MERRGEERGEEGRGGGWGGVGWGGMCVWWWWRWWCGSDDGTHDEVSGDIDVDDAPNYGSHVPVDMTPDQKTTHQPISTVS